MVAVDITTQGNNSLGSETSGLLQEAAKLFNAHHRHTPQRMLWISSWIGIKQLDKGEISKELAERRLEFLRSVWSNYKEFRPFDTISSSEKYLTSNSEAGFILRLSTSQAGKITFTRRSGARIVHSRYTVLSDKTIADSQGNIYQDIHNLCEHLSENLANYSTTSSPASYICC
uniref:SH2 domain-containing protein n=1 Tax=Vannella robusta TaxID=1487602 RepID=A0A7S4M4Y3_9EUKA|mmetsp:Transcript_11487/g.14212  ORF Transcript_11487/g.14212 Transcript_11487/m.14212 type:complete len:173 (+) Transcript_11487:35-553(+)